MPHLFKTRYMKDGGFNDGAIEDATGKLILALDDDLRKIKPPVEGRITIVKKAWVRILSDKRFLVDHIDVVFGLIGEGGSILHYEYILNDKSLICQIEDANAELLLDAVESIPQFVAGLRAAQPTKEFPSASPAAIELERIVLRIDRSPPSKIIDTFKAINGALSS